MPAFEWVHVQLHQQKGMISLSPPTICNSAKQSVYPLRVICFSLLITSRFHDRLIISVGASSKNCRRELNSRLR
ncbi:putative transposase (plasmid) [Escherichia coli]|nr:putative transposase [Escherichia coli]